MSLLITDFDGRILFLDKKSKNLINANSEEILNKKRIYNFLDNNYVIEFSNFLKFPLNKEKHIITILANKIQIKLKILFCKKKTLILDIKKNKEIKKTNNMNLEKIKIIFRSKFIIGSIIPLSFSIFWVFLKYKSINLYLIPLLYICLFFLHAAANTFNDYYDWKSGRDQQNMDYILFNTGGSRSLEFNFISEKKILMISIINILISLIIGMYFFYLKGYPILIIGIITIFSVYFYSAPPVHLASRYGLGELMHIICLGPLINFGSCIVLTNTSPDFSDFFIGFPFGFLITGCLLINECPDSRFDKLNGKLNLPAFIGLKYVPYIYLILIISAFIFVFFGIIFMNFPKIFYFLIFMLPYTYKVLKIIFKIEKNRNFLLSSCIESINLYINFSLLFITILIINLILN